MNVSQLQLNYNYGCASSQNSTDIAYWYMLNRQWPKSKFTTAVASATMSCGVQRAEKSDRPLRRRC